MLQPDKNAENAYNLYWHILMHAMLQTHMRMYALIFTTYIKVAHLGRTSTAGRLEEGNE